MAALDVRRNQHIRICDLATTDDVLKDLAFEHCAIVGPAVLVLLSDVTLEDNTIEGDMDALLWEIPSHRSRVVGAIGVENCRFVQCRFTRVGFAGPPDLMERFRAGAIR